MFCSVCLQIGAVVYGAIKSIEDRGYIVQLGRSTHPTGSATEPDSLDTSVSGFLPFSAAFHQRNVPAQRLASENVEPPQVDDRSTTKKSKSGKSENPGKCCLSSCGVFRNGIFFTCLLMEI